MTSHKDVTELLLDWSNGDQEALSKLMPMVYKELRRIASSYLRRERPGHTLQTTALVHEAYLRMVDQRVKWESRTHFFAIAAQIMRRILVDYAYARKAAKRGGSDYKVPLEEVIELPGEQDWDIIALDDALKSLAARDERKSKIIELR